MESEGDDNGPFSKFMIFLLIFGRFSLLRVKLECEDRKLENSLPNSN